MPQFDSVKVGTEYFHLFDHGTADTVGEYVQCTSCQIDTSFVDKSIENRYCSCISLGISGRKVVLTYHFTVTDDTLLSAPPTNSKDSEANLDSYTFSDQGWTLTGMGTGPSNAR